MGLFDIFNTPKSTSSSTPAGPKQDTAIRIEVWNGANWCNFAVVSIYEAESSQLTRRLQCLLRDNQKFQRIRAVGHDTGRFFDMVSR